MNLHSTTIESWNPDNSWEDCSDDVPIQRKDSGISGLDLPTDEVKAELDFLSSIRAPRRVSTVSLLSEGLQGQARSQQTPSDYCQAFTIRRDRLFLDIASCSDTCLFWDHPDENNSFTPTLPEGISPTLTITEHALLSNFPFSYDMNKKSVRGPDLHLPAGQCLRIVIEVPLPRSFESTRRLRLTIQYLVHILRASTSPLPKMRLTLASHDLSQIGLSHFVILVGPFYSLRVNNGLAIDTFHGINQSTGASQAVLCHTDARTRRRLQHLRTLLETSVSGLAVPELVHQQLCLDIKFELLHVESHRSPPGQVFPHQSLCMSYSYDQDGRRLSAASTSSSSSSPIRRVHWPSCFDTMKPSAARRLETALTDLQTLYAEKSNMGYVMPDWLEKLQTAMTMDLPTEKILHIMSADIFPNIPLDIARDVLAGMESGRDEVWWI